MIKFLEILILFFNLFSLIYSESGGDTKECLEKVNKGDCGAFISCCNSKCGPNQNQNHKCFAFMDEIQKDQTFCFCSTPTINNNPPPSPPSQSQQNQQSFNKLFDDSFPSKSLFSLNNEDNSKSSSSSSSSSSSLPSFFNNNLWKSPSSLFGFSSIPSPSNNLQQQQNNNNLFNSSFFTKTTEKQFGNQQQPQNNPSPSSPRPKPGNPSDGRHLFLTSTQTSSAIGLKRIINKKDGDSLIGRKMDFVGGIILLFVFDLLLLSLTI
ncbi:unnamed protein product [Meloidogyne enterolobii]|uniref:Uncharacterized protein n=1 Tax=Meloidogyne enterolobii TaxID=390850 RepID=A0ACB0YP08_MELEN